MMQGEERRVLEEEVWDDRAGVGKSGGWQAELEGGDGLFIPKGWWHSVKGVGDGMTGSVSWIDPMGGVHAVSELTESR